MYDIEIAVSDVVQQVQDQVLSLVAESSEHPELQLPEQSQTSATAHVFDYFWASHWE